MLQSLLLAWWRLEGRCLAAAARVAALTSAGGVLVGGNGVGKTEAVKDLSCAAGQHLVAMHCARQLPTTSVGRLVRGAAGAGAWLLVEHILELPQPTLLLLAQQVREVHVQQNGIRELPVPSLMPLRLLQTLDISMNDVSMLPPHLALLPHLQNLTIVGNPIRTIPQSVQARGATAVIDLLRKRLPEDLQ